ncbi:SDR family NAD(P)-dependent oxidoreductase [Raoultella terrigena]|uniref:SDR family NAD(P)-dependent oxidoreductase n=1 Tax=Raoultella terrigena TaxID=577 RepID=UPI000975B294|nr:SDR family NAD(P)-dependent oxidoreductase [Raoultella terrigena]OMP91112.1 short-chain dehydrogenase [Raoultella terrigena]
MKIALVTGVGRAGGLGFETAHQLGLLGYKVIISSRNFDKVKDLAKELKVKGVDVSALQLDITDDISISRVFQDIQLAHGKLDVLINNAAILPVKPVEGFKTDLEEVKSHFETNLIGTWRVTQELFPLLTASADGRVVNVSSSAGSFWEPNFGLVNNPGFEMSQFGDVPIGSYGLSKLALNGLTLKLSQDFRDHHIAVNSVCPGLVSTYPGTPGRPVEDGARSIVWVATLPKNGPTGLFFRDGKQIPW